MSRIKEMTREEAIDLVVRGEWIYSLQVGNKEMEKLTEAISEPTLRRCPNCGARMDKEAEHD